MVLLLNKCCENKLILAKITTPTISVEVKTQFLTCFAVWETAFPPAQALSLLESGTSVLARRLYLGQLFVSIQWFLQAF